MMLVLPAILMASKRRRIPSEMTTMILSHYFYTKYTYKALEKAIYYGLKNVCIYMLYNGADPNMGLAMAAKRNWIDMIKILLYFKATRLGDALREAVLAENASMVTFLISHDASMLNEMALMAIECRSISMLKLLLDLGATDIDDLLFIAADEDNLAAVKLLIERNATDIYNAIMVAYAKKNKLVFEYLISLNRVNVSILP